MKQLKTIKFPGLDDTYFVPEYDLTIYATKEYVLENVPDLAGVATEEYVQEQIGAIEHPTTDLTNYYTKAEVAGLGYMTEAQVQALITASLPASGEEVSY